MGNLFTSEVRVVRDSQQAWMFFVAGLISMFVGVVWGLVAGEIQNTSILCLWVSILLWMRSLYHMNGYVIGRKSIWFVFLLTAVAGFYISSSILMLIGFGGLSFMVFSWAINKWREKREMNVLVAEYAD